MDTAMSNGVNILHIEDKIIIYLASNQNLWRTYNFIQLFELFLLCRFWLGADSLVQKPHC